MAAHRFRRALRVLEKWPVDPELSRHRDFGVFLRTRIQHEFQLGEETELRDPDLCDRMIESIENICNNKYKEMYKTDLAFGSLGFNEQTSIAMTSDANLSALREERKPASISNIFKRLTGGSSKPQNLLEAPKEDKNT